MYTNKLKINKIELKIYNQTLVKKLPIFYS